MLHEMVKLFLVQRQKFVVGEIYKPYEQGLYHHLAVYQESI